MHLRMYMHALPGQYQLVRLYICSAVAGHCCLVIIMSVAAVSNKAVFTAFDFHRLAMRFTDPCHHPLHPPSYFRRQASGDMRLLNPVALVENHPSCRTNAEGLAILPNQLAWKQHLTLLLLSSKLLADTDSLLKIQQDSSAQDAQRRAMRMLLSGRKMPPIPYLIAGFIQKKSVSTSQKRQRRAAKCLVCVFAFAVGCS